MSHLSKALRLYTRVNSIGTREIAVSTGMSHATVSRFLNGRPVDSKHFMKLLNWLLEED